MIRRRSRHLGAVAAALVDGELGHDARDRALAHLAHCDRCRADVDAQRRLKARLRGMPEPDPPLGLLAALHRVGGGHAHVVRRTLRVRRVVRLAAAGGTALVAGTFGAAFVAGGDGVDGRPVTPPVNEFVVEHVATTDQLPLTDPDVGAVAATLATASP